MGHIQEGNGSTTLIHMYSNVFGHSQLPAVYLVGDLIWFPNIFLWNTIPYFRKILDKKTVQAVETARENYFNTLTQNIVK